MSNIFTIQCSYVSATAKQDILAAYASATKKLKLLAVELTANGQTVVGNYPIRLIELPATVTPGSSGTTPTPLNVDPTGVAPTFTAHANDTTQATTSGTARVVVASTFNPINGYYWEPPAKGEAPLALISAAFVLSLDEAPAGALGLSATMWLEEI